MKILIDNGHGENTPGKRSPDGRLREYLYTREIAEEVVAELRRRGYDAERIVRENIDVSLSTRVRRINDVCKELGSANVLLVSIHNDAAGRRAIVSLHVEGIVNYLSSSPARGGALQ